MNKKLFQKLVEEDLLWIEPLTDTEKEKNKEEATRG